MNIIDFTTKTKNDICAKISKNVSDFPSITSKTISKCGPLTKEHLAEGLLTLIKYSFLNRTRFSIELSSGKDPSELFESADINSPLRNKLRNWVNHMNLF